MFVVWNLATLLGAAGATAFGDPAQFGLDAVIPAAFLALLAPRLREGRIERRVALGGAVIALALIPITPAGVPVLAATAALLLAGAYAALIWYVVIGTVVGCYLLKLAGFLVPARVLEHGRTRRLVELVPVALLAALVVVEAVASGSTTTSTGRGWPVSASARSRCGGVRRSWSLSLSPP